ncbi:MAG: glutaminyl-peptide cyclotransferase [Anaerolineae bacterium]|nr:glutaminyl-peptide cyclotransferase [Anaerolineae bacterium]
MRFFTRFLLISLFLSISSISLSAQRPDAPTYALRGEYAVGTRDLIIEDETRPLTLTMWYPAQNPDNLPQQTDYRSGLLRYENGRALRDALPLADGAPYPVIFFSHGSSGYRFQSSFLTEHLASYGFIVIAPDHPTNTILDLLNEDQFIADLPLNFAYRPQDVMRVIDFADLLNVEGDFAGLLDMNTLAVMGHSFGGYTSFMVAGAQLNFDKLNEICTRTTETPELLYNACFIGDSEAQIAEIWGYTTPPDGAWDSLSDPRIQAVVTLAPWNAPIVSIDPNTSYPATLIIAGNSDGTTPIERDARGYQAMLPPTTTTFIEFDNADHFIFVDICTNQAIQFGFFDSCSDDVWDMQRAHDLLNHFVTTFLLNKLKGDATAQTAFAESQFTGVTIEYPEDSASANAQIAIISTAPHDPNAFTQGLVYHNGLFYESTGLYGQSSLREVNPETGEVLRQVNLSPEYFAEGLALVDDRLIQITWRENTAFIYDIDTFEQIGTYTYDGEGWGLCYDGEFLYMSDGSDFITIRDPQTFEIVNAIAVRMNDAPIIRLNELECPAGENFIMANIWQTPYLVMIDKMTGDVITQLDGNALVSEVQSRITSSDAVLRGNGWGWFLFADKDGGLPSK